MVGAVVSLLLMVQLVGPAGPEKGVSLAVRMTELALARPSELVESAIGGLLSGVWYQPASVALMLFHLCPL
jgi:hypothetical protein